MTLSLDKCVGIQSTINVFFAQLTYITNSAKTAKGLLEKEY